VLEASKDWERGKGDHFSLPLEVYHSALRRRYPDITIREIEENFETEDFADAWKHIWGTSYLNLMSIKGPVH
jgi:hypothetical protein